MARLAERTGGQCNGLGRLDLAKNVIQQRLASFLTLDMTRRGCAVVPGDEDAGLVVLKIPGSVRDDRQGMLWGAKTLLVEIA